MGKEEAKVVPRFSPNLGREKASRVIGMSDVLNTPTKVFGRAAFLDTVIEDSAEQVPAFDIDEHGNPIGEASMARDPGAKKDDEVAEPVVTREDCTAGCGRRGTVHPLNRAMVDWQCSECGKYYKKT